MEFKYFQVRVPYEHAKHGYYMDVWNDDVETTGLMHTFETGEPVWLRSDMMGRSEVSVWWIYAFELSINNSWCVLLNSDRDSNENTRYHECPVHNLVALPPMFRIAIEASD